MELWVRFTRDPGNIGLFGIYKLDGKLLIMLPGIVIDFPGKESSPDATTEIVSDAKY